jgi:hypothetical protein
VYHPGREGSVRRTFARRLRTHPQGRSRRRASALAGAARAHQGFAATATRRRKTESADRTTAEDDSPVAVIAPSGRHGLPPSSRRLNASTRGRNDHAA